MAKTIIYTNDIFEYVALNKEYLEEHCKENDIELSEDNIFEEAQSAIEVECYSMHDNVDYFDSKHKHKVLMVGTCGLWYGKVKGGKVFNDLGSALIDAYQDTNTVFFNKKNTTLELEAIHHDGTNHFKFYELTNKGEEWLLKNENLFDRETLHKKLIANHYVRAITFDRLYGC